MNNTPAENEDDVDPDIVSSQDAFVRDKLATAGTNYFMKADGTWGEESPAVWNYL